MVAQVGQLYSDKAGQYYSGANASHRGLKDCVLRAVNVR